MPADYEQEKLLKECLFSLPCLRNQKYSPDGRNMVVTFTNQQSFSGKKMLANPVGCLLAACEEAQRYMQKEMICKMAFIRNLEQKAEKGELTRKDVEECERIVSFAEVAESFVTPDDQRISFGKYKGKRFGDVPADYLVWFMEQDWAHKKKALYQYCEDRADQLMAEAAEERPY